MKKKLFENVLFEIVLTNNDILTDYVDVHLSGAEDMPHQTGLND